MNMEISIIIPVYNTAKYLKRCIDSIISQKISKEIILIDDGSTDNSSPQICDEYSQKYAFIKAIHTKNQGPASAKNVGINAATGNYIALFDSDDKLSDNMLIQMIDFAKQNNAEIVCCNFMQIDTCGIQAVRKYTLKHYVFDKETAIKNMLERNMIFNQSWTKIFKRSIIIENNIKHVEGLKTEEDFLFNLQAFMHAEKICVIDKPLYIYTHRETSLSKDYFRQHISQYIDNRILRLTDADTTIKNNLPQIYESCIIHCLIYYNELIGKIANFPHLFGDKRTQKAISYIKDHIKTLHQHHIMCGFSRKGVLLIKYLPPYFYMWYRHFIIYRPFSKK